MPRGRPKGSKNKPKVVQAAKPVRAVSPSPPPLTDRPEISAAALKRSMIERTALIEENGERTRTANEIKKDAIQKGIHPKAYEMLTFLWNKSRTDIYTFGTILRDFYRGCDKLAFDAMVPADFFEQAPPPRKGHAVEAEADEASELTVGVPVEHAEHVEQYVEH